MSDILRLYRTEPHPAASRYYLERPEEFLARYPDMLREFPAWQQQSSAVIPARVEHPSGSQTDFGWLMPGLLVWSRRSDDADILTVESDLILSLCESLPLTLPDGTRHLLLNFPINEALDVEASRMQRDAHGGIAAIDRYVFDTGLVDHTQFRLPYGSPWEIIIPHIIPQPDDVKFGDLYAACHKLGLSGLVFQQVGDDIPRTW